jgi:ribonucleotide reductase alpha subunit
MAMMPISHPDILSFIRCKQVEGNVTNFNLSVSIPDEFMKCLAHDDAWPLIDPTNGNLMNLVRSSELFDEIAEGGKRNGEPGVIFIDAVTRDNPCPELYRIEATNPCVVGDTVVNTSIGPLSVKCLLGVGFMTPDGIDVPNGFFKTKRVKSLLKVTTRLGYSILCTPEHRLMADDGWTAASDLKPEEDYLFVKAGMYKTDNANPEEFPHRDCSRMIASGIIRGDVDSAGVSLETLIDMIDCSTFRGAVCLIRDVWTMAGRPIGRIVFLFPEVENTPEGVLRLKLISSVQLALLRLGIPTELSRECTIEYALWPIPEYVAAFSDLVSARTNDDAYKTVWDGLGIFEILDMVSEVTQVPARGGEEEDVYDATCAETEGSINKHELWTGAFLSHNCSEVPLSAWESCVLGSINLKTHVSGDRNINWPMLEETVHLGTRFLNDVIMANKFLPSVPQLVHKARATMRIGLGVMGLADLFFLLGVRYGSPESVSIASQIMEFVRYHSMLCSLHLAIEHGAFTGFAKSTYSNDLWKPPTPLDTLTLFGVETPDIDLRRPTNLSWEWLRNAIARVGIRNITTTAIAPTGTLSLVAGVSGFGCEPVFALSHRRRILGTDGTARYEHMLVPELTEAINRLSDKGFDATEKQRVMSEILRTGSCSGISGIPESISRVFVCASDISVREHIMMQAALQRFVDGAISKTINLPPGSNSDDVKSALITAWRAGCKGICVYVAGSRQVEVLTAGAQKPKE